MLGRIVHQQNFSAQLDSAREAAGGPGPTDLVLEATDWAVQRGWLSELEHLGGEYYAHVTTHAGDRYCVLVSVSGQDLYYEVMYMRQADHWTPI